MSLPEAPPTMHATTGEPPSTPAPEVMGSHDPIQSPAQSLDLVKAENRKLRISLNEANVRLLHSRICHQFEAQSRQTLQQGVDALQKTHLQLATNYKSLYEENDREIGSLREENGRLSEENRISDEIIRNQKLLIGMYESQQQQQPASHLAQGGPLLPQYDTNQYSPYQQPPRSNNFVIDPAGLRPLNNFDYSIGAPIEPSCDIGPAMSTPFPEFEDQMSKLPIQARVHPTSTEGDVPGPSYDKSEETKRGEDDVAKPSKKRKTK